MQGPPGDIQPAGRLAFVAPRLFQYLQDGGLFHLLQGGGSRLLLRGKTIPEHSGAPTVDETTTSPLEEVERTTILKILEKAGGNKSEAARRLDITRRTLHKKLKKYGLM